MPSFHFAIDKKYSNWERENYYIEAETEEEAIDKMKKHFNDAIELEDSPQPSSYEDLELEEDLTPIDNDNQATRELFMIDDHSGLDTRICDNAIPPIQNPHV